MTRPFRYVEEQLDAWARRVYEEASLVGDIERVDSIPDEEHEQVIFRLQLRHGQEKHPLLVHFRGVGIGDAVYFKRNLQALW